MRAQDSVLLACLKPFESLEDRDWLEIVHREDAHDDIRRRLDQYGVFDRQLFPDLDWVAKWLRYRVFESEGERYDAAPRYYGRPRGKALSDSGPSRKARFHEPRPRRTELIRWARERAGYGVSALAGRFRRLEEWNRGEVRPTLKQLEAFAMATHTPVGFLFLQEPPEERVPIPDFSTVANAHLGHPSPDLLDTIYLCQQRQDWYRDFAGGVCTSPRSTSLAPPVLTTMSSAPGRPCAMHSGSTSRSARLGTWTEALRRFIEQADGAGVLVMVSGVVGSNNRRKLDPQEFRGLALADDLAPLVFINGADTKAAQMFTLAHELAHIWIGQSALSDVEISLVPARKVF